jgi:hypothetical protein
MVKNNTTQREQHRNENKQKATKFEATKDFKTIRSKTEKLIKQPNKQLNVKYAK